MITKEVNSLSEQKEKLPGWGGRNPILLPLSRNKEINVPQKYPRVLWRHDGHWWQWIDACIGVMEMLKLIQSLCRAMLVLTETVLMGNLLLVSIFVKK